MTFAYTDAVLRSLQRSITEERLQKYLEESNGKLDMALQCYVRNTGCSESFYTPLQGLEVTVRNSIHRNLTTHFGTPAWYDSQGLRLDAPLPDMVEKAKSSLTDDNKPVTPGGVVAELNFGFWVGILGPRYENGLWRPVLRNAFRFRPRAIERKQVHGALNKLRRLRNRVAHHEPIFHRNLREDHDLIMEVVGWICADTASWIKAHSRFEAVFGDGEGDADIT